MGRNRRRIIRDFSFREGEVLALALLPELLALVLCTRGDRRGMHGIGVRILLLDGLDRHNIFVQELHDIFAIYTNLLVMQGDDAHFLKIVVINKAELRLEGFGKPIRLEIWK